MKYSIGVIGLAVMGRSLALNIGEHGFSVAAYNRSFDKTAQFLEEAGGMNVYGAPTLKDFVNSLEIPRKIIMMVKAGEPVDETITSLIPLLSRGDLLIDGGNSLYEDTVRRAEHLEKIGLQFLGTGISGGEEGARHGPAIMPGGSRDAYTLVEPILTSIAAKASGEPCCAYMGDGGAGHFVKMVHNGIEYADMQMIAESYDIMSRALGLSAPELQKIYSSWNDGELNSYLISITADIFSKKDHLSDGYLVDKILDKAAQKGTGKWTARVSLDLGVPIPTITAAVYERFLSAMKEDRLRASQVLPGPQKTVQNTENGSLEVKHGGKQLDEQFIESVRRALYASKICAYAQGFAMMKAASDFYGWKLDYKSIAKVFRGGCIIRARFLDQIASAYEENPHLANLLESPYFTDAISRYQQDWRKVTSYAMTNGIAVPAFSSALSWYDTYRNNDMSANLLQAQRDYFGAHTYERTDREGTFHSDWMSL